MNLVLSFDNTPYKIPLINKSKLFYIDQNWISEVTEGIKIDSLKKYYSDIKLWHDKCHKNDLKNE